MKFHKYQLSCIVPYWGIDRVKTLNKLGYGYDTNKVKWFVLTIATKNHTYIFEV